MGAKIFEVRRSEPTKRTILDHKLTFRLWAFRPIILVKNIAFIYFTNNYC
jgi:hypothetical protein